MLYRALSSDFSMIGQGVAAKEAIENTGISRASCFSLKKPNPAGEKGASAMHPGHSRGVWANLPYRLQAAGSISNLIHEPIQDKIT